MSLLSDADNEIVEKPDRTWVGRWHASHPEYAKEGDALIDDWWKGGRREQFRSISELARFLARPKYGIDVSVQEISKFIRSRAPK